RADLRPRHLDPHARLDLLTGNIGNERAEPVDVQNFTGDRGSVMAGRGERGASVIVWPSCVRDAPIASWAAAWANTSRAWNVGAAPGGIGNDTKCASLGRQDKRPL